MIPYYHQLVGKFVDVLETLAGKEPSHLVGGFYSSSLEVSLICHLFSMLIYLYHVALSI